MVLRLTNYGGFMSTNHFEILFVFGRPASGKSEFFDHIGKRDQNSLLSKLHIAPFETIDDWFVLADKFREDTLWEKLTGKRKYSKLDNNVECVTDMLLYDYAILHLNRHVLELTEKHPTFFQERTLLIEFSRGGEKNYEHTLALFDPSILNRAGIMYVNADFDTSWARNVHRFEEKQKYSSLAHMIPRSQLERLYLHDDWGTLTENNESGFINIKDQKIPFATMENNDTPLEDLRNPAVMGPKYERALELLMKDYTTRLR
jgi:hypothetical protein